MPLPSSLTSLIVISASPSRRYPSSQEMQISRADVQCALYLVAGVCVLGLLAVSPSLPQSHPVLSFDPVNYCQSLHARNLCSRDFIHNRTDCWRASTDLKYCMGQAADYIARFNDECAGEVAAFSGCDEQNCAGALQTLEQCQDTVPRPDWLLKPRLAD